MIITLKIGVELHNI